RVPSHALARALIRAAGVPIAAPSANRFTEVSPTTAEHVRQSLGERVALIIDGGPTQVGIESTVLSLAEGNAVLLRPGMVSRADLESVIGPVAALEHAGAGAHAAPGLHRKHYSPRTPLVLLDADAGVPDGRGAVLWITKPLPTATAVQMPSNPSDYAAALYATLRQVDAQGFDWIAVERPPREASWDAIHDRLRRAAAE
ncbi:MAG: Sua5/YciO/YrdC/YwlC family protein, partial [Acidobacteriaceae bacterium]|nr:Sua5/YciO/YrdC/YwlC family protein [Acidobacteriaceae bacterium]